MRDTLRRRGIDPIVRLLKQGATPPKIALGVALGGVLGVFPVIGATTALCFAAALVFRLNHVAIQAVNYLFYPAQLLLLVPFMEAGQMAFGEDPHPISREQFVAAFDAGWWTAFSELWHLVLFAVLAWAVAAVPIGVLIYAASLPLLRRVRWVRESGDPATRRDC